MKFEIPKEGIISAGIDLKDKGKSFNEIADMIEKEYQDAK